MKENMKDINKSINSSGLTTLKAFGFNEFLHILYPIYYYLYINHTRIRKYIIFF